MAYAKNKHSSKVHSKNRFLSTRPKTLAQKVTLIIIISAILTVVISLICTFAFSTERITKSTISQLAAKYYEDYFYANNFTGNKDVTKIMTKYTDTGFARVPLRQLLLYTPENAEYKNTLLKYCDENATYVQFFPTEPFGKTDYRTEYTYSCNF